jgi:hypothetical protein
MTFGASTTRFQQCLVVLLLVFAFGTAHAQDAARCSALKSNVFEHLTDATTTILTTELVMAGTAAAYKPNSFNGTPLANAQMAAATDLPTYCRVVGMIEPEVKFELRLPVAGWNGRFLMQGCGGMCGIVSMESCEDGLVRDYAVANTDMGHEGDASTTSWATDAWQGKIDFAYRSTHVVTLAAKAIIAAFYHRPPDHSYFRGCSTGGRQALIEAQRFPEDFDGIVGGAPPLDESGDGFLHLIWSARASVDAQGKPLFDATKIGFLHDEALKACHGDAEGVIENPRACHFDPGTLQCTAGDAANCLTEAEVGVARKIYAGAHDAQGHALFPGGMQPGSEQEWVPLFIAVKGTYNGWVSNGLPIWLSEKVALLMRRVFMFRDPGDDFDLLKLDFANYKDQLRMVEPIYNARNPDLRDFRDRGGKLIMFHGWNDAEVPANLSIDYYTMLTNALGGRDEVEKFARLFLIPGMAHCRRGAGADTTDYLTAIVDWVEKGVAPDSLIAYHLKKPQNYMGLPAIRYPLQTGASDWARPVFPYPEIAVWNGQGDEKDPANWKAQ